MTISIDQSFLLSIAGLILGLLGIYLTIKFQKKIELFVVPLEAIDLYSSIINGIEGLTIEYNNKNFSKNLCLIKAAIVNVGTEDVAKTMIYEDLKIYFSEDCQILNAAIIDNTPGTKPILSNAQKYIGIAWNLLKPGEYITINIIVEHTKKEIKDILIHTSCRIHGILNTKIRQKPVKPNYTILAEIFMSTIFILLLFSFIMSISVKRNNTYTVAGPDNSIISVDITTFFNEVKHIYINKKPINTKDITNIDINGIKLSSLCEKMIEDNNNRMMSSIVSSCIFTIFVAFMAYSTIKDYYHFIKQKYYYKKFPKNLLT